jgi:hypothetical protein
MIDVEQRALVCLLVLVFLVGLLTLPAEVNDADPFAWREEARALVLNGGLSVDPDIACARGQPGQFFVINPRDGRYYCKYGIVNSLLNAFPLMVEDAVTGSLPPFHSRHRALILGLFFVLLSVAIAYVLWTITGYYSESPAARMSYVLLAFYTTYLWYYLRSTTSESTQLLGLSLFYLFFLRFKRHKVPLARRPLRDLDKAWLALGVLCQTRFSYLLYLPLFAAVLMLLAWREKLPRKRWLALACRGVALPVVLILAAQAAVHQLKFGSALLSGYHQWWDKENPHALGTVLYDFMLSWQWSWFTNFPLLLLALAGMRRFIRHHPDEAVLLWGCFAMTFALVAPLPFWRGEYCYGPRYFVFVLPLVSLPALWPLEWALTRRWQPVRALCLAALMSVSAFLVLAQLQVQRLGFHFKYAIQPNVGQGNCAAVDAYFATTPYARINWDHLRCNGRWQQLPYFDELRKALSPEELAEWTRNLQRNLRHSNLYWFAEDDEQQGE